MKYIKEMGLPVLVVLVPAVVVIVNENSGFGTKQWLLCSLWLLFITGGAVLFSKFRNENFLDKSLLFVGIEGIIGCIMSLFLRSGTAAYIGVLLFGWSTVIQGISDFYRQKIRRCRRMWVCLYWALFFGMLYLTLLHFGLPEKVMTELLILQTIFFVCFLAAIFYNVIERLWNCFVSKR